MEQELIILNVKREASIGQSASKIKEKFIEACEKLDASIFEDLIDEDQYFEDLDKYRFLHSLQVEFMKYRNIVTKTSMIEGTCGMCVRGHKTYQFYTNTLIPAFSYIIKEENGKIINIFMCSETSGRKSENGRLIDGPKLRLTEYFKKGYLLGHNNVGN